MNPSTRFGNQVFSSRKFSSSAAAGFGVSGASVTTGVAAASGSTWFTARQPAYVAAAAITMIAMSSPERPVFAGATGFAPVKSIVEDAFHRGLQRPMWWYWGVRTHADLYMADLAERWQHEHPNFHFVPVLSDLAADDPWPGRRGFVHEAMPADFPDMRDYALYPFGPVGMIAAAVPPLLEPALVQSFC